MSGFQVGDIVEDIRTGRILEVRSSITHDKWRGGGYCRFIGMSGLLTSWSRLRLIQTEDLENV